MSQVREWLEAIDLAQYADLFEANDLDIDLLQQVDDQILKDIGVSSAGHRLRAFCEFQSIFLNRRPPSPRARPLAVVLALDSRCAECCS